jgi:hypothetical protein
MHVGLTQRREIKKESQLVDVHGQRALRGGSKSACKPRIFLLRLNFSSFVIGSNGKSSHESNGTEYQEVAVFQNMSSKIRDVRILGA